MEHERGNIQRFGDLPEIRGLKITEVADEIIDSKRSRAGDVHGQGIRVQRVGRMNLGQKLREHGSRMFPKRRGHGPEVLCRDSLRIILVGAEFGGRADEDQAGHAIRTTRGGLEGNHAAHRPAEKVAWAGFRLRMLPSFSL